MTKKTGREACNPELQRFIDEFSERPFIFTNVQQVFSHRNEVKDSAKSVQDMYQQYVKLLYQHDEKLEHKTLTVNSSRNFKTFEISIFTPERPKPSGGRQCLYFIHGGGLVTNNRFSGINSIFPCIHQLNAACITIEYSLAPETKAPTQIEQCYKGLKEFWNKYKASGEINFTKLAIIGRSAGAALLVGLNFKILDDSDVNIKCNIMSFPMLDDACDTKSHLDFRNAPHLPRETARFFWAQYLGNDVPPSKFAIPALAKVDDLKGFPPTLLEKGNADVLGVEAEEFHQKLVSAGVDASIRSYAGYHCFDTAEAKISDGAKKARAEFLKEKMA